MPRSWPVDDATLDAARELLSSARKGIVIACHSDVDGLSSAVILQRTLAERRIPTSIVIAGRGEHIHTETMRDRVREVGASASALVVADMGSRGAPVGAAMPTLVIDHHDAAGGVPPDALVVNGYKHPPVAPTSVLSYVICKPLLKTVDVCWLAALGAIADLGTLSSLRGRIDCTGGGRRWSEAIALLNAARRAPEDDSATALDVLMRADSVDDLLDDDVPGVAVLRGYRERVNEELARCSRVAPRKIGDAMLIRFSSAAQVHPVVAIKWARRLAPAVVIAANDGFINGRVNFAIRCGNDVDLLHWLRSLPFTPLESAEYANGHARATGGSLTPSDFERFLVAVDARAA